MQRTSRRLLASLLLPLALTGTIAGCGSDDGAGDGAAAVPTTTPHDTAGMEGMDHDASTPEQPTAEEKAGEPGSDGEKVDLAFVRQMTPHHLGAVLMSTIAVNQAERNKLKSFAARVVQDQSKELATLQRLGTPLGIDLSTGAKDGSMAKDMATLGLPADAMGMSPEMLGGEQPFKGVKGKKFDRAYVDAMIEHHEGAVEMAKVEQQRGSDPEIKELAKEIQQAQEKELETLRTWQRHW